MMTDRPTRTRRRTATRKRDHYTYAIERGVTNAIVFRTMTPGYRTPVAVLWNGPGSPLYLVTSTSLTRITADGADGTYYREADATDAFVTYFDAVAASCAAHYADAQAYM